MQCQAVFGNRGESRATHVSVVDSDKTFYSQGTFVFTDNKRIIFMADRWIPSDLQNSTYVWFEVDVKDEHLQIRWEDSVV